MFVMAWALSFVVHGLLLGADYAATAGMRPPAEAQKIIGWLIGAQAIFGGAFAYVYIQGKEDKPWLAQGIRFGIAAACPHGDPDLHDLSRGDAGAACADVQADRLRHHPRRADGRHGGVDQPLARAAFASHGCGRPVGGGAEFGRRMVPFWQDALGAELIGVYLLGSLAHGGFSARYSDVDMAVISEAGLPPQVLERARPHAAALSADWGPKLSVFWTDRQFRVGRFLPLDRVDYLDHAVVLTERERVRPPRPMLDEVRSYLRGAPFANWTADARRFAAVAALETKDRKAFLRTLLYPARLCFSYTTGRMGSNDEAVAFFAKAGPVGLDVGLVARALEIRQSNADPDPLFSERNLMPAQVAACAALIGATGRLSQGERP